MEGALKSYLVKLGYDVDPASLTKFKNALKDADKVVKTHTESLSKNYTIAASAIVAALVSITVQTAKLLNQLAEADIGYQKFAMRMYMARDAAKAFKIVTESMGERPEDIAWIPELTAYYRGLMKDAQELKLPEGFDEQMKTIRSIRNEFNRFQVEATYGLQWVGHYIFLYLEGPIRTVQEKLEKLNKWIKKNIPDWAKSIAKAFRDMVQLGSGVARLGKDIYDGWVVFFDALPGWAQKLAIFGGAFWVFSKMGPVGIAITAITALTLLLDDFYNKIDGHEHSDILSPMWDHALWLADRMARVMTIVIALGDRFWATMRGKKSVGQVAGLSVIDEITELWNTLPGITGKGAGFKRTYDKKGDFAGYERDKDVPLAGTYDPSLPDVDNRAPSLIGKPPRKPFFKDRESTGRDRGGVGRGFDNVGPRSPVDNVGPRSPVGTPDRGFLDRLPIIPPVSGMYGPLEPAFAGTQGGEAFQVHNDFEINFHGVTSEEQMTRVEAMIQKYQTRDANTRTLKRNRVPAIGGVGS